MRTTLLHTPPVPLLVDPRVFDAFAWCTSTVLEWKTTHPSGGVEINTLAPDLPERMAFVLRAPWDAVPVELARLHVGRAYGMGDAWALAPYGIDDATDALFEHKRVPSETFWLAADNLNALFWGLHDWVHFHNHGPFEDPTSTELQCDLTALCWSWINREALPLSEAQWRSLHDQVVRVHRDRIERQSPQFASSEALALLESAPRVISLAQELPEPASGPWT